MTNTPTTMGDGDPFEGLDDRVVTALILAELSRRHPDEDWRSNPPCPDCDGMGHFECNGRFKT